MLSAHAMDREILVACRRLRRGATAGEIAEVLDRVGIDGAPHARTVERHLMGLTELGLVERSAEIRGDRPVKVWKIRICPPVTETVHHPA